ncbi:MAG: phosphoenolpyruvate synthase [Myxococcaceae bacterium]
MTPAEGRVRWFTHLGMGDVPSVGGKNASLGEMIRALSGQGIRVPNGFATTSDAYWEFLDHNHFREELGALLGKVDRGEVPLDKAGEQIRARLLSSELPPGLVQELTAAYEALGRQLGRPSPDVAVRSSATAEDLPDASFAGQQESFLNIRGEDALKDACRRCFASLFTDRAISYRQEHRFDHMKVALSVGIQEMVRSDKACAGVLFTLDTETGFPDVVLIDGAWGLGETVVQGNAEPDEFVVFKPLLDKPGLEPVIEKTRGEKERKLIYAEEGRATTRYVATTREERDAFVLSNPELLQLARWGRQIERHYGRPMDVEWAKDGETGELAIVQARPETVHARREAATFKVFRIRRKGRALVSGASVGGAAAVGKVFRLDNPAEADRFEDDGILVTGTTDPDWVPIMRRASAIVTDHGGRTSHAAIVSRELGVPAVVGTGTGTQVLRDGDEVTVSCAEGDRGFVYEGRADIEVRDISPEELPHTRTRVMVNLADPGAAFRWWRLPTDGIGLARMEFIVGRMIQIHPMALVHPERVREPEAKQRIDLLTRGYADKREYFVEQLALGISRIAASQYPRPVVLRTSDFKTNEYSALIGGSVFEPAEENPMIGWRGASRYYHEGYREGFALECQAIRRARERIGLENLIVMIPFCRTLGEADRVLEVMGENGLRRGEHGLKVYMMCEIPSNVILARAFAERFDGFSIGSNDLTQLVLGVDRDSELLSEVFDEWDDAVTTMIAMEIATAHRSGTPVGFCGQAPSNDPEYAGFLVQQGIDSISVTPDSFVGVKRHVAAAEDRLREHAPEEHPPGA